MIRDNVLLISLFVEASQAFHHSIGLANPSAGAFNWSSIDAHHNLQYRPCYNGYECAKLSLPQDWHDPHGVERVAVAIIKLPAVVHESDPSYSGTIVTNPGGPGGSGISDLLIHGEYIRSIVDGDRHYDILSFDPRGIYHSAPKIDCFDQRLARQIFAFQQRGIGVLDKHDGAAIRRHRALAEAFGEICSQSESIGHRGLAHMSTAVVARDMLEIVDQVERHQRHKDADRDQGLYEIRPGLQYIGFSYGTQLGNTFASMFPDRVKAMVLDGVVDSTDYSNGMWSKNLFDTESIVQEFFSSCFRAGTKCSLRLPDDTDSHSIEARVDALIHHITDRPRAWVQHGLSEIITAQDIRGLFTIPLYMPVSWFEHLASALAAVIRGNYSAVFPDVQRDAPLAPELCRSSSDRKEEYDWGFEAALTYICNDGEDFTHISSIDLQDYIADLQNLSPTLGSYWAQFGVICSGWKLRPAWRFAGPYGRNISHAPERLWKWHSRDIQQPLVEHTRSPHGNNPVLFLSSRKDPVTPLRNAVAMSQLHPGSSVVIQESIGHCATYSSPSTCTKRIVEAYFANGTMPQNGTSCAPDCRPFSSNQKCKSFEKQSFENWAKGSSLFQRRLPFLPQFLV